MEDFQRLVGKLPLFETYKVIAQVRDEHLLLKPNQLVWLGATYQQVHQVLLNMFNINCAININIKSIVGLAIVPHSSATIRFFILTFPFFRRLDSVTNTT